MKFYLKIAVAMLVASPFMAAHAAPITYFGQDLGNGEFGPPLTSFPNASSAQANFLSGLINPGVENFEDIADGTSAPLSISFSGAGSTATLQGSGEVNALFNGLTNGNGRYGISGDPDGDGFEHYWNTGGQFSISLSNPVAAFGFYGIDIGDFDGHVTVTATNGHTQSFAIPNSTNIAGGSVLFWGFIDPTNTYTKITFGNTEPGIDIFGFDNFTVASLEQVQIPVPAPGSLLLLIAGLVLVGLGVARQRRHQPRSRLLPRA